ncbi:MAG: TIGR04002 family protein [Ruminococcus sp.]|nr:TIGR04002 family protein [Ruminococcus sp.]
MKMKKTDRKLILLAYTGLFAALTYVLTSIVRVPTIKGYVHIGDAAVFLAGSLLPAPYAAAAGAIGASLSDALSGYFIWVPATFVIKALTALSFSSKKGSIINKRNLLALAPALVLCVVGYGLYSGIVIYGDLGAGFADAAANAVQSVTSGIIYVLLGEALDKSGAAKRLGFNS